MSLTGSGEPPDPVHPPLLPEGHDMPRSIPAAADLGSSPPLARSAGTPSRGTALITAAEVIFPELAGGRPVDARILRSAMEVAFGGSDAEGFWTWKDAYEAGEAALVLFLRRFGPASRVQQIVDWLGADFDGVIVFDESHAMQNAAGSRSERGDGAPSQQGRAGLRLQHALPNARVLYVSATGATTVQNLAYAQRLGLWGGEDFPFANRAEFVAAIETGGVAAMEVLARDLRALGLYTARSLSYDGVEYELVEHPLTPEQTRIYDAYRLQTDEGERVIGRRVAPHWIAEALGSEAPKVVPSDAWAMVLERGSTLQLEGGLSVRRSRVMNAERIELTGFTDGMVERLKALGLMSEIISWRLRLFIPIGSSRIAIQSALLDRFPLRGVVERAWASSSARQCTTCTGRQHPRSSTRPSPAADIRVGRI